MAFKIVSFLLVVFLLVSCGRTPENESNCQSVHFAASGINDGIPAALVHDGKQFHLFFQGKISGDVNKWEQTTSSDLIHWEKSSTLQLPDSSGVIKSAGFAIDWDNTSGLAKDGQQDRKSVV